MTRPGRRPEDAPPAEERPVSLAGSIRAAFRAYLDEIVVLLGVNAAWVILVGAFVLAGSLAPTLIVLLSPMLALPTAVLTRMAVVAARGGSPRWSLVRDELPRRAGRKLVIAAVQLVVLGIGITNVGLAGQMGNIAGVLSAIVAGYAIIAVTVYAVALWPIVCDPARDGPLRHQLRLAAALVVLRPLQLGVLAVITALAVVVSVQLIVPALFLPMLVLLTDAAYVVNAADRVRGARP